MTSHHTASHHITSHRIASHHITSHHFTSHHITPHHTTPHPIPSHPIPSHHITSHHITSHHITSHHITSHHITSHHITSHHITCIQFLDAIVRNRLPRGGVGRPGGHYAEKCSTRGWGLRSSTLSSEIASLRGVSGGLGDITPKSVPLGAGGSDPRHCRQKSPP